MSAQSIGDTLLPAYASTHFGLAWLHPFWIQPKSVQSRYAPSEFPNRRASIFAQLQEQRRPETQQVGVVHQPEQAAPARAGSVAIGAQLKRHVQPFRHAARVAECFLAAASCVLQ